MSIRGSGTAAAMALRAACSGLQIQDFKPNKPKPRAGPVRPPCLLTLESPLRLCPHPPRPSQKTPPLHPTLVSPKNSKTASMAPSAHSHLTDGALGCSQWQSSPILFHSLLIWETQAPTLREKVAARLPLPAVTPPILTRIRPLSVGHPVVEKGAYRCMAQR